MLESEGGYRTALRLLSAKDVSDGFTKLWQHGRIDLTVEALIVESEWRSAFDPALIALAEKKLKKVGYAFVRADAKELPPETKALMHEPRRTVRQKGANRIVIPWPCGDEYIDIDLDTLGEDSAIYWTKQTYPNDQKSDIYVVSSTVRMMPDGDHEIAIVYDKTKNPDITDSWWGTTRILIHKDAATGYASWHDSDDDKNNLRVRFSTKYAVDAEDSQQWAIEDLTLAQRTDLEETVKQALRSERRGQHLFRARVLQREQACRLTGVDNPAHLRASHIKPWAKANPRERLDENNGLMLAPHVDHLFDRAYISFNDDGTLLVLNDQIHQLLKLWGIDIDKAQSTRKPFNSEQCVYLDHHRERFEAQRQTQIQSAGG
jgi:hypothetical protein